MRGPCRHPADELRGALKAVDMYVRFCVETATTTSDDLLGSTSAGAARPCRYGSCDELGDGMRYWAG